jgi:hypothetical protein
MTTKFVETNAIEVSTPPIDTTGAAQAGDWYHLKYYGKLIFVIAQGAWAGGTPAVTLEQATSAAGANNKVLSFTNRWTKVALTGAVFTETAVVANTFNLPAVANTINVLEVNAEDLDVNNDFEYVSCLIADPGANADLITVLAILSDPRYSGAPGTHLPDPKV